MPVRAILVLVLASACGSSHTAPAGPAEPVPLPPSGGSPIGYLVDDATDLKLTDPQLTKLRQIDDSLAAELEELDATDRAGHAPAPGAQNAGGGRRGGGRRGGGRRGGGGMSGGMGGGGMSGGGGMGGGGMGPPSGGPGSSGGGHGGRHGGGGPNGGATTGGPNGGGAARVADERVADVKDALARAFEVLDDTQRVQAKKLLSDRGVDLDTPAPASKSPASEGSDGDGDDDSDDKAGGTDTPIPDQP